jgi:hypothetical protein
MPKPTAKGFPCKPEDCYVSRHLDGPEYKVYDQMRAAAPLAKGKRMFYASVVPYLCNAANQSRSAVDATLDRLEAAGWIINHGRTRRADGTETPNHYEIIEHLAWAAARPGRCPDYKYAPSFDEETGLRKGQRYKSGPVPKNFWPTEPVLRSALEKILSEKFSLITNAELTAFNGHIASIGTTPGQPGLAPLAVDEAHSRSTGTGPLPGNEKGHSRATGTATPGQAGGIPVVRTEETLTHTHTTQEPGVGVCGEKPSAIGESEVVALLAAFVGWNSGSPGKCTPNQRKQLKELAELHGREKFRAAVRAWKNEQPWDARTTDPFLSLISGFPGYLATIAYAKKQEDRKADDQVAMALAVEKMIFYTMSGRTDFVATLTADEQEVISKTTAARSVQELPAKHLRDDVANRWHEWYDNLGKDSGAGPEAF